MLRQKISKTCKAYNVAEKKINLIAVSKTVGAEKINQAIAAKINDFGENYLQEAKEKWPEIRAKFPQTKLHFIGGLQSNKTLECLENFDVIHSLDREKLALVFQKELAQKPELKQKNPEIFIQINIGQESQKSGIDPLQAKEFINFARHDCGLNIVGLMCVPPSDEEASPYFALLTKIAQENALKKLSMGMSSDFVEAIAFAQNIDQLYIRIGSAIFGERQPKISS